MSKPLILKFDDIGAEMLPLVGGKAANLGVLTSAGLPVPPVCASPPRPTAGSPSEPGCRTCSRHSPRRPPGTSPP